MPGSVSRHLLTCVTTVEQLKKLGGCSTRSDDECWLWKGLAPGERRRLSFKSPVTGSDRRRYVYVIAWILSCGDDPEAGDKPLICHTCDDGRCFNPKHLFSGTNAENLRDMSIKGRAGGFRKMDPELQRKIASKGGKRGAAMRWTLPQGDIK